MKGKYLILGIASVITIVILWYVFGKKADKNPLGKPDPTNTNPTTGGVNTNGGGTTTALGYPILYMQYSEAAKKLQSVLGVDTDGKIGSITLKAWQKYNPAITQYFQIQTPQQLSNEIAMIAQKKNSGNIVSSNTGVSGLGVVSDVWNIGKETGALDYLVNAGKNWFGNSSEDTNTTPAIVSPAVSGNLPDDEDWGNGEYDYMLA